VRLLLPKALLLLSALAGASPAAARLNFLGTWHIIGSQTAPWVRPSDTFGRADIDHLDGKRVIFSSRAITAPVPLACKGPNYEVKDVPPDYLFQGTLTAPAAQAKALGYVRPTVTTLETGCEGAIDFHFIDDNTALFALNNRLYRMERVRK